MSVKSTLYAFYFQKSCRESPGFFFSVRQFTQTSTLFYAYMTKRLCKVIKNSAQGEKFIQDKTFIRFKHHDFINSEFSIFRLHSATSFRK
jgi:hypothetical protein